MASSAGKPTGGVAALVLAAGAGRRMGAARPKQHLALGGRPLFLHALEFFLALPDANLVCLVLRPGDAAGEAASLARTLARGMGRDLLIAPGGRRRQDSALAGLRALPGTTEIALVHDAARPFPPLGAVRESIAAARESGGAILALPAGDTVKEAGPDGPIIARTLDRRRLWLAQTPQTFQYPVLLAALEAAERDGVELTDEASALERLGQAVRLIPSTADNIKVTVPEDWARAERILAARRAKDNS